MPAMTDSTIQSSVITVQPGAPRSSLIYIGHQQMGDLVSFCRSLNSSGTVAIITHPELDALLGQSLKETLRQAGFTVHVLEVPAGEKSKDLAVAASLLDRLLALRLERRDIIVALGGGVIGDLAGFVASVYLRGIYLIQMPTTLLAQVDAAIGGKTGVNHAMGKNLIGTFYQPHLTFIDIHTLHTLPKREIRCGLAEVVKYGVIRDAALFTYLETHCREIALMDTAAYPHHWRYLIETSARIKAEVVTADEQEAGLREILNFGHTVGHGIESVFSYSTYHHGEAVALGMKSAAYIAVEMGLFPKKDYTRLLHLLSGLGFTLTIRDVPVDRIFDKLFSDKKVRKGKIRFVLPEKIGHVVTRNDVSEALIRASISLLSA